MINVRNWLRSKLVHDGMLLGHGLGYEALPEADQLERIPRYKHRWQLPIELQGARPLIDDCESAGYRPHSLEGMSDD